MFNPALLTVTCYFFLNLVVTLTNKQLVSLISCPYLLTASHAFCTFVSTNVIALLQRHASDGQCQTKSTSTNLSLRTHAILVCFSLLYITNIAVSNLSLGLVSLSLHQTIRATAPAITVLLCVTLLRRPLTSYSTSTYLSLIPTTIGVILATTSPHPDNTTSPGPKASLSGIALTFLGAVLAVLKTVLTNTLQRRAGRLSVDLPSTTLIRYLSPYAVAQALLFALWTGEFQRLRSIISSLFTTSTEGRILATAATNVLAAATLNLASFEANRRCGPLAMAVAANLKQVLILLIGRHVGGDGWRVMTGALMTIVGGVWYSFAQRQTQKPSPDNGEMVMEKHGLHYVGRERLGGL
ncbi:uncharacterized protein A1O9_09491 [Exophiala aquamarina CBS 119918]|uniref:Sugar phosphate transporter domain-containing protein n=1 Tax=Exophiala aquamarina CBS 119918 TaxID=1182545 RepID=A0A072PFM0_9EURO|nr:uncharacterized protein A1O9_09491 [Exophiala aquamarina CBS 119918]KEF54325.1 hypothetical protein A1O9_09491 [Exophiala aquamarina CBS 119918]